MTFFHFVNCIVLAYAPYFITYKYSGLNEYSSFWKCIQAGIGYFLTQLIKLLLLATFFPASDSEEFALLPELLKSSADFIDVIGMHLVMTYFLVGKGEVRFMSGGLGWGAAHSLASRLLPFWVGARASAFSWRWIQQACSSSSDLIFFFAMAASTWMSTRNANRPLIFLLLFACVFHSFFIQLLIHEGIQSWSLVIVRFIYSSLLALGALYAYAAGNAQPKKIE
ncbi:hypothetical protein WR25_02568 [Diploscapter pachys]|uniref:BOS complex subunit TMEM147 n=1 Tax=Diploscapter pachys TaxID=2018661 RepID=A0A2A2LA27_9BILA|nr:hypothetical protein WR25_02568 [Diploscapter pachys]